MNKKQVTAFLKTMTKDDTRPKLNNAFIDKRGDDIVMVATNGLIVAAVYLDEDAEGLVGRAIRRDALERWVKLATGKSRLTGYELQNVSNDDYAHHNSFYSGGMLEWQHIIDEGEPQAQEHMSFNAEYFKIVQDIDGDDRMRVQFYGELNKMLIDTARGIYVVMPMHSWDR